MSRVLIGYFDGAAEQLGERHTGIGVYLIDEVGSVVFSAGEYGGVGTSNQAEYRALIRLLEEAIKLDCGALYVRGDSLLIIQQMAGEFATKNEELIRLRDQALELASRIPCVFYQHVPRNLNTRADKLSKVGLAKAPRRKLTKARLLTELGRLETWFDEEAASREAVSLLMRFIDDPEIERAVDRVAQIADAAGSLD